MEKINNGKKVPFIGDSILKKARFNIILLSLAIVLIGLGAYFNYNWRYMESSDIELYNKGVSSYNLELEILPATTDRPSESSIIRAAAYFQEAADISLDNTLKSLSLYNLGTLMGENSLIALIGETPQFGITEAINKLSEAIRLNPNNEEAKYNLEFLEKAQTEFGKSSVTGRLDVQAINESVGSNTGQINKGY